MRELFELAGLGWRIPIHVKWASPSMAEVTIAELPLLKIQRQAAGEALRTNASHREGAVWFFDKGSLEKVAFKSGFTDPEDVVVWKRLKNQIDPKFNADFTQAYCASRHAALTNPKAFVVIWDSVCKFMLEWLLFHDGTVDLGFAKIDAFCFRENWKNCVVGRMVGQRGNTTMPEEQARRELRRTLHQSFLTAYDETSRTMRWTLEITPTKSSVTSLKSGK